MFRRVVSLIYRRNRIVKVIINRENSTSKKEPLKLKFPQQPKNLNKTRALFGNVTYNKYLLIFYIFIGWHLVGYLIVSGFEQEVPEDIKNSDLPSSNYIKSNFRKIDSTNDSQPRIIIKIKKEKPEENE